MSKPKPGEWLALRTDKEIPAEAVAELAARGRENGRAYRMCGCTLNLRCDDAGYLARFDAAFRNLGVEAAAEPVTEIVYLTRGPEGFPVLLDPAAGRALVFAHESVSPTQLFATLALQDLLPIRDQIVLHASVVERNGQVTTFLGRTHAGKTTLALALALEDGVGFLSDEYCPIRIPDGFVEPFPRVLGIRAWTREMLEARGALPEDLPETDGYQMDVDPCDLRGYVLGNGGPLRNVVVVAGEAGEAALEGVRDLDVEFVNDELLREFAAVAGVSRVEPRPERVGAGRLVRVHVGDGASVTEPLLEICERHGMTLHGLLPPGAKKADFKEPPLLQPIDSFRGLCEIARHVVNRESLNRRIGDESLPKLLDLAAATTGGARFFQLRPGPLDETVRLVLDKVL